MVSISVSKAAALYVGRKRRSAGVLVYRDMLKNGEFIPKTMIGMDPGGLFILADNRTVPVWVEKEFFDQLGECCSVSISVDSGLVKRLKLEIEEPATTTTTAEADGIGNNQSHRHHHHHDYLSA
jgi:hypothetical protein